MRSNKSQGQVASTQGSPGPGWADVHVTLATATVMQACLGHGVPPNH